MAETKTISCVISTCDRQEFLLKALDSVLAQTRRPDEIIIVNNGKNKLELPQEWISQVKIINVEPYLGASRARNMGSKAAQGDYLAFLDDDDRWGPDYLAAVVEATIAGADCVISRMDYIKEGKVELFKNPSKDLTIENLMVYNPGISGSNIVIAKEIFWQAGGYDENLKTSEDKALMIEILKRGVRVVTLPENQVIINYDSTGLRSAGNMAAGICQFTKKYKKLMSFKQFYYNWYKIFYYRHKAGDKLALVPYAFLVLFFAPRQYLKFLKK